MRCTPSGAAADGARIVCRGVNYEQSVADVNSVFVRHPVCVFARSLFIIQAYVLRTSCSFVSHCVVGRTADGVQTRPLVTTVVWSGGNGFQQRYLRRISAVSATFLTCRERGAP